MKTDDLKGRGLTQEQIDFVMSENGKDLKALQEDLKTLTADIETVKAKRDEYKKSLETVEGRLKDFDGVNVEDLKGQIATLTTQLADEKKARETDAQRAETEKNVNAFLASLDDDGNKKYEFLNDITEDFYRGKLMEELSKDSAKGKSIGDIFTALTTEDGKTKANIFVDRKQEQLEATRVRDFTRQMSGKATPNLSDKFKAMNLDELMKLKASDPAIYDKLRKGD